MRIQHNIMAMNAYRNYTNNTTALSKNLEKLSSGYKINRAGDDAAGLAISEKMRAQITGLKTAQKNVKDGISLVKTAEGATQEIHDMLNRMVDLATQSANGTYQDKVDREAITNEFEQLKSEINRIADSANFNGIKLLNGELAEKEAVTKIDISGNFLPKKSEAIAGVYTQATAITAPSAMVDGDTFSYTVALDDGTSYTAQFKIGTASDGKTAAKGLYDMDGNFIKDLATAGTIAQTEATDNIIAALNKTELGEMYKIEASAAGTLKFTANEAGTATPKVSALDYNWTKAGAVQASVPVGVTVTTPALDEGMEITAADITEYDGKNYDEAVFTINGKKFVLMAPNMDATTDNWFKATEGLGKDVTILVGGTDGLTAADPNWAQNIKKIAEATGLTVTDAVDEKDDYGAAANTGTAAGAGIRLSIPAAGVSVDGKGLTLQIGDDSEPHNQLKVSIGDMHTKALGLDNISLGTQAGAQAAVTAIKDAINYVSQVRGTLGATQNRLEHTQNNLSVMAENIQDAESTIRDTDVAEEMMAYTKNNILVQSAQAMLAQANQVPQGVLQLLG